jgi:methylmalonyl-CoA/ethylmalonyl-CoA epimerase
MIFHHIGIACDDIEKMLGFIKGAYNVVSISEIVYDQKQDANVCMVHIDGGQAIELVSGKQVAKILEKKISLYHVCYEVKNLAETLDKFVKNGSVIISEPKKAALFGNRKVAFVFSPAGIIEFMEKCS